MWLLTANQNALFQHRVPSYSILNICMTLGLECNSYALFLLKKIVSTLKYGQNNEETHFFNKNRADELPIGLRPSQHVGNLSIVGSWSPRPIYDTWTVQ